MAYYCKEKNKLTANIFCKPLEIISKEHPPWRLSSSRQLEITRLIGAEVEETMFDSTKSERLRHILRIDLESTLNKKKKLK